MELNVGDYVRTKNGHIGKIIDINLGDIQTRYELDNSDEFHYEYKKEIIQSSPNIIDLIEVGDYVNNYYVENIINTGEELVLHIITGSNYFQSPFLYNEDIKSILTHEQFEAMKYRAGDN